MTTFLTSVAVIAAGYLIGGIPFALLLGRARGVDIRREGSGNIGATNVTRALGRNWGIACFALDCGKGLIPVLVANQIAGGGGLVPTATAVATVVGHICPLYLKFQGGKGMATSFGALLALTPLAVLLAMAGWVVVYLLTRFVSLASLVAAVILPASALIPAINATRAETILLTLIGVMVIVRHRSNIRRLLSGQEHRFSGRKQKHSKPE